MMISAKGKHNFWSQLLLSMIAIFALPHAQGLEAEIQPATQSQSALETIHRRLHAVRAEKIQQQRQIPFMPVQRQGQKRLENRPHFAARPLPLHAPIRASPRFFC